VRLADKESLLTALAVHAWEELGDALDVPTSNHDAHRS